jgi:hypothetical protein
MYLYVIEMPPKRSLEHGENNDNAKKQKHDTGTEKILNEIEGNLRDAQTSHWMSLRIKEYDKEAKNLILSMTPEQQIHLGDMIKGDLYGQTLLGLAAEIGAYETVTAILYVIRTNQELAEKYHERLPNILGKSAAHYVVTSSDLDPNIINKFLERHSDVEGGRRKRRTRRVRRKNRRTRRHK